MADSNITANGKFFINGTEYFIHNFQDNEINEQKFKNLITEAVIHKNKEIVKRLFNYFYYYFSFFYYGKNSDIINREVDVKYEPVFKILTEYLIKNNIDPISMKLQECDLENIINEVKEKNLLHCTWGPCNPLTKENLNASWRKTLDFNRENPQQNIRFGIFDKNSQLIAFITVTCPFNEEQAIKMGKDVFDIGFFVNKDFQGKGFGSLSNIIGLLVFYMMANHYRLNLENIDMYASCAPDNIGSYKILQHCFNEEPITEKSNYGNREIRYYFKKNANTIFHKIVQPIFRKENEKMNSLGFHINCLQLNKKGEALVNLKDIIPEQNTQQNTLENMKAISFDNCQPAISNP